MDDFFPFDKIDAFWEWFGANDKWIRETLSRGTEQDKEALVQSLNNQILGLGMFTWELGHGRSRPFYLTISPNGSRELLDLSCEIVDSAPFLSEWEFNPAKPAQEWDLKFRLYDEDYNERDVDASSWKFSLQKHPANGVIILLEAGNVAHLDKETKQTAADLVVISLLGEEQKIVHVREIDISPKPLPASVPIQQLKQRFEAYIF